MCVHEYRDTIGHRPEIAGSSFSERDAFIEAEYPVVFGVLFAGRSVFDYHRQVVDFCRDVIGQLLERPIDDTLEVGSRHVEI